MGFAVMGGHDDDFETVENLFSALPVQRNAQMTAAESKTDCFGRPSARAFG